MNLLKKTLGLPLALAALTLSAQAMASQMEHTIKLQATVPTSTFKVLPSDPSWIGNVQILAYNILTEKLGNLSKPFDVRNTAGPINAHFTATPLLAGPNDNIGLIVKFNGIELTGTSAEVVDATRAQAGHVANLEIIPQKGTDNYKGGTYSGNVHIAFDAMIAAAP